MQSITIATSMFIGGFVITAMGAGAGAIKRRLIKRFASSHFGDKPIAPVEYAPPLHLSPAEIAYLYDKTFGEEELLATLLDLERRGHVQLVPNPHDTFVVVLPTDIPEGLNEFEQELIIYLRNYTGPLTWTALSHDVVAFDTTYARLIERVLVAVGLLQRKTMSTTTILWIWAGTGIFTSIYLVVGIMEAIQRNQSLSPDFTQLSNGLSASGVVSYWVLLWIFLAQCFVGTIRAYRSMAKQEKSTALLRKLWPQIEGYRMFVERVELGRITFSNAIEKQNVYDAVLPYAVALNLRVNWRDRFRA